MHEKVRIYGRFELPDVRHPTDQMILAHRPIIAFLPVEKRDCLLLRGRHRAVGILSLARSGFSVILLAVTIRHP